MRFLLLTLLLTIASVITADDSVASRAVRKAIPDRLVVLTFDDSAKSHHTLHSTVVEAV